MSPVEYLRGHMNDVYLKGPSASLRHMRRRRTAALAELRRTRITESETHPFSPCGLEHNGVRLSTSIALGGNKVEVRTGVV